MLGESWEEERTTGGTLQESFLEEVASELDLHELGLDVRLKTEEEIRKMTN